MTTSAARREDFEGVHARGVCKRYLSQVALDGLDFDAPRGAVTALLGPNGAGKTTAIRIFTTLLAADVGEVWIAGRDAKRTPQEVRRAISASAQQVAVDEELTGFENLVLTARLRGRSGRDARARSAAQLERFGLGRIADRAARTYSGGEKRRLDLALTLLEPCEVLFLDEPTTGLDTHARRELWQVIKSERDRGVAVVLTTQYLEEVDQLADFVTILGRGRALSTGTPSELKMRVGGRVLAIKARNESDAAIAALALTNRFAVDVATLGRELVLPADAGGRAVTSALQCLEAENLTIESMLLREPSIEDVFLRLTGGI